MKNLNKWSMYSIKLVKIELTENLKFAQTEADIHRILNNLNAIAIELSNRTNIN